MQRRTAAVVLAVALCASFALGELDVATDIVSPRSAEPPGLVAMQVRLTNVGDVAALVPRLNVVVRPVGYSDYREDIAIPVGESTVVAMNPLVYPGDVETCLVWTAYPNDRSYLNNWDAVIVNPGATAGRMRIGRSDRGPGRLASTLDVAIEFVSPGAAEEPGLVPVQVRVINVGDVAALVTRLDVEVRPSGYMDYREDIAVGIGESTIVAMNPWVYGGGSETCFTWITYDADQDRINDADVAMVSSSGISGRVEMEPHAGMSLALSPSPLAGNVLHIEYSLNQAGLARLTLCDITGRVAVMRDFVGSCEGSTDGPESSEWWSLLGAPG